MMGLGGTDVSCKFCPAGFSGGAEFNMLVFLIGGLILLGLVCGNSEIRSNLSSFLKLGVGVREWSWWNGVVCDIPFSPFFSILKFPILSPPPAFLFSYHFSATVQRHNPHSLHQPVLFLGCDMYLVEALCLKYPFFIFLFNPRIPHFRSLKGTSRSLSTSPLQFRDTTPIPRIKKPSS